MRMLENEQLRLRAMEPEDLDLLYQWENDTRLWKYGSTLVPFSRYVLHQYIENAGQNLYEDRQLRMIIELLDSATPIGTIDLYDFDPFHNRAGLGILIDESHQGKGYAAEALLLMKGYAFGFLKLRQLYSFIPALNIASIHLFRNNGFVESGLLKNWNNASQGTEDVFVYQCFESEVQK
jgi:diamine N-acetyltransferase